MNTIPKHKIEQQEEIDQQVKEYLAKKNKIEKLKIGEISENRTIFGKKMLYKKGK